MLCPTCPSDRHAHCRGQGCHAASAVPVGPGSDAGGELDLQVKRLDVENGDILVVRTKSRLAPVRAAEIHDQVAALASRHGVRDVTVMVLDDCSDLTIERPGPVLVFKPASVGKSEAPLPPVRSGGSDGRISSVAACTYDAAFVWEAERVVANAKATGDYRGVTHHHAMAAMGQVSISPDDRYRIAGDQPHRNPRPKS